MWQRLNHEVGGIVGFRACVAAVGWIPATILNIVLPAAWKKKKQLALLKVLICLDSLLKVFVFSLGQRSPLLPTRRPETSHGLRFSAGSCRVAR